MYGTKKKERCVFELVSKLYIKLSEYVTCRQPQWLRGLRRRSTAALLLRSWVRIPPGAWMFVCCVLSGRGLCDGLITRPKKPSDCVASLCVITKPRERGGHSPRWTAEPEKIIVIIIIIINYPLICIIIFMC
jgi:hypothetical protein